MHLYIHVPFCARRCSYCDFAIAVRRTTPSDAFCRAVLVEWSRWQHHAVWAEAGPIATIYLGGGTPSRLSPDALRVMLDRIAGDRPVAPDPEVTLEANPDDVSPHAAAEWLAAGINRVSLGAQSFEPAVLTWMHRTHRSEQTTEAVAMLRDAGFENLSLDLIFGLPAHLPRSWRRDLDRALALGPDHISLYALTVEERTPLSRWIAQGRCGVPEDEHSADEYLEAHTRLRAAGFEHYEVSNASRPGFRAKHNSAYWSGARYIGLGPSAHSYLGAHRQWNVREWAAYQRAIQGGKSVVAGQERLDGRRARLEHLYLGLRTSSGIEVEAVTPSVAAAWQEAGWAVLEGGRVRLTVEGWLRLDALVTALA
ncbi:MAG: radical SAM family heme chaperone HemW [Gemmatimonadales bacterium]|nr:MAG: radical SAM family heme chaperone HemW [Gemmatimonadales bacterium]